uniref:Protein MCM10 homolog n=1 Tax=Plectus sambesii TaxID=2011161 RepID=A0A914X660_9BILA
MATNDELDRLMALMGEDGDAAEECSSTTAVTPSRSTVEEKEGKVGDGKWRRSSIVSMGNQTFHSAVDEASWLGRRSDVSDDSGKDMDETLSPTKQLRDAPVVEESPIAIAEKLRQLDREREALQKKLAQAQPKRTLVPLDFSPAVDRSTSSQLTSASLVHPGDISSDEDEFYRNRDTEMLSKEGRQLKKKLAGPVSTSIQRPPPPTLTTLKQRAISVGQKVAAAADPKESADVFDSKFGVRIRNPKVSSATFKVYCGDMHKIRACDLRPGAAPVGEWITMGVIVEKTSHKKSANGNEYMIMKLSDLTNCQETPVKLLLFGECLKQQWKLNVATAVALVCPMWLGDAADGKQEVTLKLTQPSQLVELGQCPDFAFCKAPRKDGQNCRNFVNRSLGDFCVFHLASAAKSLAARRGALQSDSNIPPKSWNTKKLGDFSNVFYGGKMVGSTPKTKKGPAAITLEQSRMNRKVTKVISEATSSAVGSTNTNINANANANSTATAETSGLNKIVQETPYSFGSRNLVKHMSSNNAAEAAPKPAVPKARATSFRDFLTAQPSTVVRPPTLRAPTLGRGIRDGLVTLDSGSVAKERKVIQAEVAKRKAAQLLRQKGGIPKADPNSLKSSSSSSSSAKRPLNTSKAENGEKVIGSEQGPAKRTKLGDIDFTDEQIRAILDKKSSHQGELDEEDKKREAQYFNQMESKEKLETRMTDLKEVKNCKVITCKRCAYTWHSQSEFCKTQGHLIQRHTADRRFFKCRQCQKRCVAYELLPSKPCKGCSSNDWERVGMKDERKGPALPQETLKLRGDEQKYV